MVLGPTYIDIIFIYFNFVFVHRENEYTRNYVYCIAHTLNRAFKLYVYCWYMLVHIYIKMQFLLTGNKIVPSFVNMGAYIEQENAKCELQHTFVSI